jgi:hypothetical protein
MGDPLLGPAVDYDKIATMVERLVQAIAPKSPLPPAEDPIALRAEYQVAVDVIKLLSDIRFRCLVFVTSIAALASALLPSTTDSGMRPALGVLGLLATLGITIYDLRNSQLYDAAMHRAKTLENRLGMEGSSSKVGNGGLFSERPPYVRAVLEQGKKRKLRFWFLTVKHDYGLALIYGAALGAWVYLASYGLLALPAPADLWKPVSIGYLRLFSAVLAIAAGTWSIIRLVIHDKKRLKKPLPIRSAVTATRVLFNAEDLIVHLSDGRTVATPLAWYRDLERGTDSQRKQLEIVRRGERIRWPDLKVDINVEELLAGRPSE